MSQILDILEAQEARVTFRPSPPLSVSPPSKPPTLLDHFKLSANPFSDSVNPEFFYKTDTQEGAYLRMMAAIEQDVSLALVTGRSGTGKTLLSQMILRDLDADRYIPAIVLVSPGMGKTALLREVLTKSGVELDDRPCHTHTLLQMLSYRIIDLYRQGRKLVILIDDCHFLSADSLHTLRTLSNIEVPEKKLLTCILLSEPRLLRRLRHPNYEALRGRMYMQAEIGPINAHDVHQYVKYRLLLAGGRDDLFCESGLKAVQVCSGGICRLISKVCSCALPEAFVQQAETVQDSHVWLGANCCMPELKAAFKAEPDNPESAAP